MRALKHLATFLLCAGVALVIGYWGVVLSLSTFAPGGDVTFTEAQKKRGAAGDAIVAVFDWPSQHLLGQHRSSVFSSVCYGVVFYGAVLGLRRLLRKSSA
jgi:hypothetical protein